MKIIDKRTRDRLIKGIMLNISVLLGCLIYIYMYIVPQYTMINETIAQTNTTIINTVSLKSDWVNTDLFAELLDKLGKRNEIQNLIFTDSTKLNEVLKKPATVKKDYIDWLIDENKKINVLNEEIFNNNMILGNIIPILVNSSTINPEDNVDNQITLSSFISYIEKDILAKYSLSSYASLGMSNIIFPEKDEKENNSINIGSFKVTIDFKGKDSNIISLINSLQESGKITIRDGKLVSQDTANKDLTKWKWLSSLSNLLVGIDTLSLKNLPDPSSENNDNEGSITLNFYVEGMNYEKILLLESVLTTEFESLKKSVQEKGLICSKKWNPLCNETTANAIATIKGLTKDIGTLQGQINTIKTTDESKKIDVLLDIKTSLQTIKMIYQKNNTIIEKAKK